MEDDPGDNHSTAAQQFSDDIDSCCSTPYASAPSSPGRSASASATSATLAGFYYSAPTSPTHFIISTATLNPHPSSSPASSESTSSFEFDFSATFPSAGASSPASMTSADELFCNGQIRPMKLSGHLRRPHLLAPLVESDDVAEEEDEKTFSRGRESKLRAGSLRRRTRSMSPNRTTSFEGQSEELLSARATRTNLEIEKGEEEEKGGCNETTPCASRSSSAGRSSRRWVFLKEFLYRSKSEGQNGKFWGSLSLSPVKDNKKTTTPPLSSSNSKVSEEGRKRAVNNNNNNNKNGKRRVGPPSAHELHYTANRAQAEEMRKRTFLPYRQGLLGCLGFTSKSYGAINGFARALNPVSSR